MDTQLTPAPASPGATPAAPLRKENRGGRVTFGGVLASEAIKFGSLLSTLVLLLCTVGVMVGFGALQAWGVGEFTQAALTDPGAAEALGDPTQITDTLAGGGMAFAQLIIGSLAVLVISSEFATGMSRATFAAVPRRWPVFAAKALIVAVVAFAVTALSMVLTAFVIDPILDHYGLVQDMASEGFQRSLWTSSLYVMAVALIGFALGGLLRNSAGAIVGLAGLVFVVPLAMSLIPGEFVENVRRFLPTEAATTLILGTGGPDGLEQWQAALALGAWTVVPLALAGILLQRRDI